MKKYLASLLFLSTIAISLTGANRSPKKKGAVSTASLSSQLDELTISPEDQDSPLKRELLTAAMRVKNYDPDKNPTGFARAAQAFATVKRLVTKLQAAGFTDFEKLTGWHGLTMLHMAALHGHLEFVEYLLEEALFSEDVQTARGETPLHLAAFGGHITVITTLLNAGADTSQKTIHGDTPLHFAVTRRNPGAATALLQAGADLHAKNFKRAFLRKRNGSTSKILGKNLVDESSLELIPNKTAKEIARELPEIIAVINAHEAANAQLFKAAQDGDIEKLLAALAAGAYINAQNKSNGFTALHYAAQKGHLTIIQTLARNEAFLDVPDNTGKTPVQHAILYDKEEAFTLLLTIGANKKTIDTHGNTLLHTAAENNRYEIVIRLLNAGINIEARNYQGETALHLAAASKKRKALLDLLIARHANINAQDVGKRTALFIACDAGLFSNVQSLLQHPDIDVTVADTFGNTPLHAAAFNGHTSLIPLLLSAGSNPKALNKAGQQAQKLAILNKHDSTSAEFDVYYAAINTLLDAEQTGTVTKDVEKAAARVGKNLDMVKNAAGLTLLYAATLAGNVPFVETLLNTGANITQLTSAKSTILHAAAGSYSPDTMQLILERSHGLIDINAQTNQGWTPLHVAITSAKGDSSKEEAALAVTKRLLSQPGINGSLANDSGWTALHCLAEIGSVPLVEQLFEVCPTIDINATTNQGSTAAIIAVKAKNFDTLAYLLGRGTNPRGGFLEGKNLFSHVVASNNMLMVNIMLQMNIEVQTGKNYPLLAPIKSGNVKILKLLLEDQRIKDTLGMIIEGCPLFYIAVQQGHGKVVEILAETPEIDVTAKAAGGFTALHMAAERGFFSIVQFLLQNTIIDPLARTDAGDTAYDLANASGFIGTANILKEHVALQGK